MGQQADLSGHGRLRTARRCAFRQHLSSSFLQSHRPAARHPARAGRGWPVRADAHVIRHQAQDDRLFPEGRKAVRHRGGARRHDFVRARRPHRDRCRPGGHVPGACGRLVQRRRLRLQSRHGHRDRRHDARGWPWHHPGRARRIAHHRHPEQHHDAHRHQHLLPGHGPWRDLHHRGGRQRHVAQAAREG